MIKEPYRSRFIARVDVTETERCVEWSGSCRRDGYGQYYILGRGMCAAHRISYEVFVEDIPSGMYVLHQCDNKRCVNPAHLFLGTAADNTHDSILKGRFAGQGRRYPKFKRGEQWLMRRLAAAGIAYSVVAPMFKCSTTTVRKIVRDPNYPAADQHCRGGDE